LIVRTLGVLFVAALILGDAGAVAPKERTAILTVPASSLVFSGEGLQPPDSEGHFAIGIKLPLPSVRADHCDTPNLIVGMGSLNKPEGSLTDADLKIVARNKAYYDNLLAAAKQAGPLKIHVRNKPTYLKVANGVIFAPYCTLSIDEETAP
jgi:hypothetical protein